MCNFVPKRLQNACFEQKAHHKVLVKSLLPIYKLNLSALENFEILPNVVQFVFLDEWKKMIAITLFERSDVLAIKKQITQK